MDQTVAVSAARATRSAAVTARETRAARSPAAVSIAPAAAIHRLRTTTACTLPRPSKNAVERIKVAAAPAGRSWPTVPQGVGSISGALDAADRGLARSIMVRPDRAKPRWPMREAIAMVKAATARTGAAIAAVRARYEPGRKARVWLAIRATAAPPPKANRTAPRARSRRRGSLRVSSTPPIREEITIGRIIEVKAPPCGSLAAPGLAAVNSTVRVDAVASGRGEPTQV